MQSKSDAQLLGEYAAHGTESAFAEIVARHANLVYSAALRQLETPDLAAEVAQSAFIGLARGAASLAGKLDANASLAGWLCRSARNISLNLRRDAFRRLSRERQAMENLGTISDTAPDWECLRPVLDDAMSELSEPDYDALVLRFFKQQDLRTVGLALGVSDDTAQKRVARALDKLRELLSRRGITTPAIALSVTLSAHAVQAAPAGLTVAISTAAALAGTAIPSSAAAAATKIITLSTLQKTLIGATLAVAIATGIFQTHQAAQLRDQNQALREEQASLAGQFKQSQLERDQAAKSLAVVTEEMARLKAGPNHAELLRLRGEVAALRQFVAALEATTNSAATGFGRLMQDPAMREYIRQTQLNSIRADFASLFKELNLTPEQTENVIATMSDLFMKNTDQMYSVKQGTLSAAEIAQDAVRREEEFTRQLQPLLGEKGCARVVELVHQYPAHATLNLLNGQLGARQLSEEQNNRLLGVIKAEPYDLTRGISDWDPAFWGTPADIDAHLSKVAESNQHILQQAGGFLTPEQLSALNTVLTNGVHARITQAAALIQKP